MCLSKVKMFVWQLTDISSLPRQMLWMWNASLATAALVRDYLGLTIGQIQNSGYHKYDHMKCFLVWNQLNCYHLQWNIILNEHRWWHASHGWSYSAIIYTIWGQDHRCIGRCSTVSWIIKICFKLLWLNYGNWSVMRLDRTNAYKYTKYLSLTV